MANFAIKVIRLGFSTLGNLFPSIAARLAFWLFCRTPSRRPESGKATAMEAEGRLKLADAQKIPFPVGVSTVMAYRLNGDGKPGRPRYLVVHGWGSNAAYIAALPTGLAATGAEVVALDFPGHGLSSGRSLDMRQAVEAIAEAERRFSHFDAVIGHSFGGACLMLALGGVFGKTHMVSPARAVTIGSPSHIRWLFDDFARMVGLPPRVKQLLIRHTERIAGAPLDGFDTVAIASGLTIPLLVVHAEDDKEVSADHARRLAGTPARVHWANGLGHRRIVSDRGVIDTIAAFLTKEPEPPRKLSDGDAAA